MSDSIYHIFDSFRHQRILVIGDVMTDEYIWGHINRISPEAPVPIVDVYRHEHRLGGAANVALNLRALGALPMVLSVVGDDPQGYQFKDIMQHNGLSAAHILLDQDRKTTVKTRILSRNQQLLRYDTEDTKALATAQELALIDTAIDLIYSQAPSAIILQDYNKGVLTPSVIANVMHNAKQANIPVAVDPKKENFFAYGGCTLFKPNLREAVEGTEMLMQAQHPETLVAGAAYLRTILNNPYTVITLAEKGIFIATDNDHEIVPAYTRPIVDVSGAGDTVIAVLTLGLALGLDMFAMVELANIAAGLVCSHVGVVPVDRNELIAEASKYMG